jgi:hypothetical protein
VLAAEAVEVVAQEVVVAEAVEVVVEG